MSDPFRELREPVHPVEPDPGFAGALRARLERAVLDPTSARPTSEATMTTTAPAPAVVAARLHALTPRLTVTDAREAVAFYVEAFGATRRGDPVVEADGRVGHVELAIGDSVLMLADEYPEYGLVAPVTRGGATGSVVVGVADPDAVVAAALAAGAALDQPVTDSPYGRGGVVVDPSGHRWRVTREVATVRSGDVVYTSIWTADVDRAARFFGAVLGWRIATDHRGDGRRVTGLSQHVGIYPTTGTPTAYLCYAVADVDAAVAVVRAAGGTADEPTDDYGRTAMCVDDLGIPFALNQASGTQPPLEPGGLSYTEIRATDPGRARAFYGSVLGLRYLPGSEPGYWHPDVASTPVTPMGGLGPGPESVVVATFAVTDIDAAVAAVATAGGRADPVDLRSGARLARCVDDQGMAFGLQQI